MPIEIKDLNGGVGVSITERRIVTEKEYVDALTKHLTQDIHKFKKYRYCLADWTAVSRQEITARAIELIAIKSKNAAIVNPVVVIATVAGQDIMYGLTRKAKTLRDRRNWENAVFRNRQDAEAWLEERVKEKYGIDDLTFD